MKFEKVVVLATGALLWLGQTQGLAGPTMLPLRSETVGCLYNGIPTQTIETSFGTAVVSLPFTGTVTYDFYSPAVGAGVSFNGGDKGGGVIFMSNSSTDTAHDFAASGRMQYFDYDPVARADTLICDTGDSAANQVNHGQTVNWNLPNAASSKGLMLTSGHVLHVAVTLKLISGNPGPYGALLYNGPSGASTVAQLPQNRSITWNFLPVGQPPDATITLSAPAVMANSPGNITSVTNTPSATYVWTITNGTITAGQGTWQITWTAGANGPVTLGVSVTQTCTTTNSATVTVLALGITAPPDVVLECPADTCTNNTGVATVQNGCSPVVLSYADTVATNCGGSKVIVRNWMVSDSCGNAASAPQTITVVDTTPPTVTPPPSLTLPWTADLSTNSAGVAAAQDSCSAVSLGFSDLVSTGAMNKVVLARTWTATDACGHSASALQTITVNPPAPLSLPAQADRAIPCLSSLTVTNTATNPNTPPTPLSYQLLNPPSGAAIDGNGVITWTPTLAQSPSTNVITTVVTTTVPGALGSWGLSATNTFVVTVSRIYDGIDLSDPAQALVDSDGDGLTNLVEFAVGTDPWNGGDANLGIQVWIADNNGGKYLAMRFKERTDAAALQLQYLPEVSADQQSWYADSEHVTEVDVTPLDAQFNWVTVEDTTAILTSAPRFIRLRVVQNNMQAASETWIGAGSSVLGNGGAGSKLSLFSFRMVTPVEYAGRVSSLGQGTLMDTNSLWTEGQFNGTNGAFYLEFTNGWTADISATHGSNNTLVLADDLQGLVAVGDWYRIRRHYTIGSVFGQTNSVGLGAGLNFSAADNILLDIPETQQTMTIFYYPAPPYAGWYRANYSAAANQVIYPEQGLMVRRKQPGDLSVFLAGLVRGGPRIAPIQRGYNLVGTLDTLQAVNLSALNLYTGDATTGLASGLNPAASDNLLVVQPLGSVSTFFYYKDSLGHQGWYDAAYRSASTQAILPGSAFFIWRKAPNGPFNWMIPAEVIAPQPLVKSRTPGSPNTFPTTAVSASAEATN